MNNMTDLYSLVKAIKADNREAIALLSNMLILATPVPVSEGSFCGKIYPPGTTFCMGCGRLLDYEDGYKYCPDCGQKLDWTEYLKNLDSEEEI